MFQGLTDLTTEFKAFPTQDQLSNANQLGLNTVCSLSITEDVGTLFMNFVMKGGFSSGLNSCIS